MRRLIVLLALIAAPAFAGDLPVKAPPLQPLAYPTTKCGWFYGLSAEGTSGVVNGAPAGTVQIGGEVGALVGWACPSSPVPWFVQYEIGFQNLNAGNAGFSMRGPLHMEETAAIQTPLFSWIGQYLNIGQNNIPQPVLPPGVTLNGQLQNYVGLMVTEDDVSTNFGLGSNREWLISVGPRVGALYSATTSNTSGTALTKTPIVIDAFAAIMFQSNSACVGVVKVSCAKFGDRLVVGLEAKL